MLRQPQLTAVSFDNELPCVVEFKREDFLLQMTVLSTLNRAAVTPHTPFKLGV